METKGVASVRSPVRNLQQFNRGVTHEAFVDAVVHEFNEEYGIRNVDGEVSLSFFVVSPLLLLLYCPNHFTFCYVRRLSC